MGEPSGRCSDILKAGMKKHVPPQQNPHDVRHAMRIDYFSEENLKQLTAQE